MKKLILSLALVSSLVYAVTDNLGKFDAITTNRSAKSTVDFKKTVDLKTTDGVYLPSGTAAQRPTPTKAGMIRFNSDIGSAEIYDGVSWGAVGGGGINNWFTAIDYKVGDVVIQSSKIYQCLTLHTSGVFNTDFVTNGYWTEISNDATTLAGIVPIASGGTGSATRNFVDLSSNESISGIKTFLSTISGNINGNAATATNAVMALNATNAVTALTATNAVTATTAVTALTANTATTALTATNALNATNAVTALTALTANSTLSATNAVNFLGSLSGDVSGTQSATTIGAGKVTNTMLAGSIDLTTKVTGILPLANGGTGSATKNFLDLSTGQVASGDKVFSGNTIFGDNSAESTGINVDGTVNQSTIKSSDIGGTNNPSMILHRHSTTLAPSIYGARSNSEDTTHAAVTANQPVLSLLGLGAMGSGAIYEKFAQIDLQSSGLGSLTTSSAPGKIVFSTTPNGSTGPTATLTLDANKSAYFAGNVGIGTSAPGYALDIWSGGSSKISAEASTGTVRAINVYAPAGYVESNSQKTTQVISQGGNDSTLTIGTTRTYATAIPQIIMAQQTSNGATGAQQVAVKINPTWNQSGSAAATDLQVDRTETAVGSGIQLLADFRVGGASKFYISSAGSTLSQSVYRSLAGVTGLWGRSSSGAGGVGFGDIGASLATPAINFTNINLAADSHTSGNVYFMEVSPLYNQTSGTASNTDLLINRTQTAVGTGAQLILDAQVNGLSKFNISNTGLITSNMADGTAPMVVLSTTKVANLSVQRAEYADTVGNLLTNWTYADTIASPWISSTGTQTVTQESTINIHSGTKSLKSVITATSGGVWAISQDVTAFALAKVGQEAEISAWLYSSTANVVMYLCPRVNGVRAAVTDLATATANGCARYTNLGGSQKLTVYPLYGATSTGIDVIGTDASATIYIDNAFLGDRRSYPTGITTTPWTAYTSTFSAAFGTTSAQTSYYKRIGSQLYIKSKVTLGTAANSVATMTLPTVNGVAITTLSSIPTYEIAGQVVKSANTSSSPVALYTIAAPSSNVLNFTGVGTSNAGLTAYNGTDLFATGNTISVVAGPIEITEWQGADGSYTTKCDDPRQCETVFSAVVSASSVVSAQNTNGGGTAYPWIASCTNASPTVCTFTTGIFTVAPNCTSSSQDDPAHGLRVTSNSTTVTTQYSTDARAVTTITCTKQDVDYKNSKVTQQVVNARDVAKVPGGVNIDHFVFTFGTTDGNTGCSASPCSYIDQIGNAIYDAATSPYGVTRSGTGAYTLNTKKTYTKLKCSTGAIRVGGSLGFVGNGSMSCASCNSLQFNTYRYDAALTDGNGTIMCDGTY